MILPGKHLRQDRALLGVGAEILSCLSQDLTVSELWESMRMKRNQAMGSPLSFDWFILALSFLFAIAAVELENGIVVLVRPR